MMMKQLIQNVMHRPILVSYLNSPVLIPQLIYSKNEIHSILIEHNPMCYNLINKKRKIMISFFIYMNRLYDLSLSHSL